MNFNRWKPARSVPDHKHHSLMRVQIEARELLGMDDLHLYKNGVMDDVAKLVMNAKDDAEVDMICKSAIASFSKRHHELVTGILMCSVAECMAPFQEAVNDMPYCYLHAGVEQTRLYERSELDTRLLDEMWSIVMKNTRTPMTLPDSTPFWRSKR